MLHACKPPPIRDTKLNQQTPAVARVFPQTARTSKRPSLLDTHAAIWPITESDFLGPTSRATIRSAVADGALFVSAITFWEIALLASKRRLQALRTPSQQRMTILNSGVHELPITGEIAILSVELESSSRSG